MTADHRGRVDRQLLGAALGQGLLLGVLATTVGVGVAGFLAAVAYATGLGALLRAAVRRRSAVPAAGPSLTPGLGPANLVTLARAVLVGGVTAIVADGFAGGGGVPVPVPVLVGLAGLALILDGVDGRVARRTASASALGARFDMELDAFLILVLSVYAAPGVGVWVLAIGLMRYVYVGAGWLAPWLRGALPPRYSAKVVAVVQGVVLLLAVSGLIGQPTGAALVAIALGLLLWSFGHDVVWLWRRRPGRAVGGALPEHPTPATATGATRVGATRVGATRVGASTGSVLITAAAIVLVLAALVVPDRLLDSRDLALARGSLVQIPVEAVIGAGLLVLLPRRVALPLATIVGALLGVLTVLALLDVGFLAILARPFDPIADWGLADSVVHLLTGSLGRRGAIAAVAGFAAAGLFLMVGVTLAVRRLARILARRPVRAAAVISVLVPVCLVSAAFGAEVVPGAPLASADVAGRAVARARQVVAGPGDQRAFQIARTSDAFRETPADQLLAGLRGKDVVVAFVESYGRDAVEDPTYAPLGVVLDEGSRRLDAAGFSSRSAFLTSPVAGGGSWLAHATFLSGLWVNNERRQADLTGSDRLTLVGAFRRAGWRTVAVLPGTTQDWPEGRFYGYDQIYDTRTLGYRGPDLGWATTPDQYSLARFEQAEHGRADRTPLFAEIEFVSSHAPWPIIPEVIDWSQVGDGTVYESMTTGEPRDAIWAKGAPAVRTAYRRSLEYSWQSLISWVETYGDDDLVLVVLGDHEAAPLLTGPGAGRDVPITVVARDPAVERRVAAWGWDAGLTPRPEAPVWRMDTFRDRFLAAFTD